MKEKNKYILLGLFIFLTEAIALFLFEKDANPNLNSLLEAMWWIVIFLSSGFEVIPQTLGGRIVGTFLVIEGFLLLGFILAQFAAHFVEKRLSGGKIMKKIKFKNHIIVCGWTSETPRILDELTSPDIKTKQKIVVLADLKKNPLNREDIYFIKGNPTQDTDLIKAGISSASTAIILLDRGSDNPDAKVILTALAVESLNRSVYTCAELENPDNEKHLVHAHVDEIVCHGRVSQNLIVHSAIKHGLSRLFSELMTHNVGHEFYKIQIPKRFQGMIFPHALKLLLDEEGVILTAIERNLGAANGSDKTRIVVNPGYDFILEEGDWMFVISKEEPQIW